MAPEGRKSRLAKAAGAEPAGQLRDEKCTPLWRKAHVEVKIYKAHNSRTTFGNRDVEKCALLWREAHVEVKMYKTPQLRTTFGKLRCRKKCTLLWRKAHFEVKMLKTPHVRATFGRSDFVSRGRRKGLVHLVKSEEKVKVCDIFKLQPPLHHTTRQYTTLELITTTLHYIPLHFTTLHSITLNYIQLHSINYTQ